MSEDGEGVSVAATRQNAGSALNGGMPRPPLYPRPRPAVFAVTLPGTAGTEPSVPASADEPPPPRAPGLIGAANAPAFTTSASVIAVFCSDKDVRRSHAADEFVAACAMAAAGVSTTASST